jgi:hypothetical protein
MLTNPRVMCLRQLILLLILFCGYSLHAANGVLPAPVRLSGVVTDEARKPLSFANVYVQGTSKGTTTNVDGHYALDLEPGSYELVFRFIGYKTQTRRINVSNAVLVLDVQLQPESLVLQTFTVSSKRGKREDPAYGIIRNTIARRKYFLDQVKEYSADVYLKGLQHLSKSPKRILGQDLLIPGLDSNGRGIVYLSEAVSKYYVSPPDQEKEVIVSSKVSGLSQTFTFNSALDLAFNFYDNLVPIEVLSERGFVSPVSANAFFFYDYKLEGTYPEGEYTVHKIKVTPRRQEDPAFRGYLYIQDTYWRIHSTDLYLTKEAKIDYVDTFRVAQTYIPVRDSLWMLGTQKLDFTFGLLGFEGNGYYVGIYSNYELDKPASLPFKKGEIGKIETDANQKDSTYWNQVRAVPLTDEENDDYQAKEKLEAKHNSKEYKDSLDAISNQLKPGKLILGYTYSNRYRNETFTFGSILENLQYNTVEGFVLNLPVGYNRSYEERKKLFSLAGTLRYGFASRTFYGKTELTYTFNRSQRQSIGMEGGHFVSQFNENAPISPFVNTVYSLLLRENHLKLFEKTYLRLTYSQEITNGLYIFPYAELAQRNSLSNHTDFSFSERNTHRWTSNNPLPGETEAFDSGPAFDAYRALTVGFNLAIRFKQTYYSRPDFKFLNDSKYPRITLSYRKGIPGVVNSISDYDFVGIRVQYNLPLGLLGQSDFDVSAGTFLNRRNVPFVDFRHFYGNQTLFSLARLNALFLLPYYQYSTTESYLEGHYEHHFNGFLFNKIPIFRKLKFQEVLGGHLLITDAITYAEVTLGIENILKVGRIDFATSFQHDGDINKGIRVRIGL